MSSVLCPSLPETSHLNWHAPVSSWIAGKQTEAPHPGTYMPAGYPPPYPPAAFQGKVVVAEEKEY